MDLASRLEGILFFKSEPMSMASLVRAADAKEEDAVEALTTLEETLSGRGIVLVRAGDTVALMTAPGLSDTIEKLKKEELKRDIGKAGAETLAIIVYHGSITRPEIDYIRGVNSTFILRNLLMRGLIERIQSEKDQRSFAYRPTIELFAHLGISKKEELPQYHEMKEAIDAYKAQVQEEDKETAP